MLYSITPYYLALSLAEAKTKIAKLNYQIYSITPRYFYSELINISYSFISFVGNIWAENKDITVFLKQ